jgi:two-component system response regulator DevR
MSKPTSIRLVLVDDSEMVRAGLKSLLAADHLFDVVGEAAGVATGVAVCVKFKPDVVLLDIRLPDGTGFQACSQILAQSPDSRVLILTSIADEELVDQAIRAGAHGYLLKEIDAKGLTQAIIDVAAGKSILDPAVTARVMTLVKTGSGPGGLLEALSPQERRVLALIAEGNTNKEVGSELGLSEKTVKNYLSNVFEKLHVTRRAEAAALYARQRKTT